MFIGMRFGKIELLTACVLAAVLFGILFLRRQLTSFGASAANAPVANALVFISDSDSIDAGRGSNSVYRIGLDGIGGGVGTHPPVKRIVGSIPHGDGYLRISDIACEPVSQQLVIASHKRGLNGFHHARLDGSGLHLDKPAGGDMLAATQQIALAPDGFRVIVSRQFGEFREPRFGLVAGDLLSRFFEIVKPATAWLSYRSPAWSPDSARIVYIIEVHADGARPVYRLALAAPDGSDERLVYETALTLSDVAWSPDGEWLALEMSRMIYKLRPDGSELTQLSSHRAGASSPRWSPDGARISFVAPSSFMGFHQLLVIDAEGGNTRQVANIRGEVVNGCWV